MSFKNVCLKCKERLINKKTKRQSALETDLGSSHNAHEACHLHVETKKIIIIAVISE